MPFAKLLALVAIMAVSILAAPGNSHSDDGGDFPNATMLNQKIACGNGVDPFCCDNSGDNGYVKCSNISKTFSCFVYRVMAIIHYPTFSFSFSSFMDQVNKEANFSQN